MSVAAAMDGAPGSPETLRSRLVRRIRQDGPMSVAEFMLASLQDPHDGYYATHPALGAQGDFVTAPMVSQMFGELIGAWLGEVWMRMGRPSPVRLVELGPGDGTLMGDMLRVLRRPSLAGGAELDLWLVEPSRPLRTLQGDRLATSRPRFADGLAEVPGGAPLLLVANEVFDCLPARQFVRTPDGWAERRVGLGAQGDTLVFGLSRLPAGADADLSAAAPPGAVVERSSAQAALAAGIGARIASDGGAALIVDYGPAAPGFGDTLQAVSGHRKVDPLAAPGRADLTVHADFPAIAAAARQAGARTTPIVGQGRFLRALGIEARAAALARARPDRTEPLRRQLDRLIAPEQMGDLFKVLAIHSPGLAPPGFPGDGP